MSFRIYNASAGSGKTFALIRHVLDILMNPGTSPSEQDRILAITFTNKAAAEMKQRLLDELTAMAQGENSAMLESLQTAERDEKYLRGRARQLLDHILFHFDQLHFSTIDKWNLKIIRTFARELGVSMRANVEINDRPRVREIIQRFLTAMHPGHPAWPYLVWRVRNRIEDGDNWDITDELGHLADYILPDHYERMLEEIDRHNWDPSRTARYLRRQKSEQRQRIRRLAQEWAEWFGPAAEKVKHANHYLKLLDQLSDFKGTINTGTKAFERLIMNDDVAPKKGKELPAGFEEHLQKTAARMRQLLARYYELEMIESGLQPLYLMRDIARAVEEYKETYEVIFISDFNKIIRRVVDENPAPFIYWRAGQKLKHYFIDEFQDTSQIQWHNLVPLIGEAFSGIHGPEGSATLLGDAKQSIYRFRGAYPEQFIALGLDENHPQSVNPFAVPKEVTRLEKNWRSLPGIVDFNNRFFAFAAEDLDPFYREVYTPEQVSQIPARQGTGYVEIAYNLHETDDAYHEAILERIRDLRRRGYRWKDIAVLFPRNQHGSLISAHLLAQGVPAVSPDSLKLRLSPKVQLLVDLFRYYHYPSIALRFDILTRYAQLHGMPLEAGYYRQAPEDFTDLLAYLNPRAEVPGRNLWAQWGFYEFFVRLAGQMLPDETGREDAYVRFFLDTVLQYQHQWIYPVQFLDFWEQEMQDFSFPGISDTDAVQLMSIHKAKGLEFPAVILAYPQMSTVPDKRRFVWLATGHDPHIPPYVPVGINRLKKAAFFDEGYARLYEAECNKEKFDALNKYYVAFTRPKNELYVMLREKKAVAGDLQKKLLTFARQHLEENTDQTYLFAGRKESFTPPATTEAYRPVELGPVRFTSGKPRLAARPAEDFSEAVRRGADIHRLLARLHYRQDLETLTASRPGTQEHLPLLQRLTAHPQLQAYFEPDYRILAEQEIAVTDEGQVHLLRPDRICIHRQTGEACIMEFKTGRENPAHRRQLARYMELLNRAGYKVTEGYLVYLTPALDVYRLTIN